MIHLNFVVIFILTSDKCYLQCKFNFNRENIFSKVIKIFTLETKEFNEALARLKEPVGENAYVFRYTEHTFEGDEDYYFCHGNQQCPKYFFSINNYFFLYY